MKVRAKNDDIRNVLYHPTGGRFREDGTADWPDDAYTHRRIVDGDVTEEEESQQEVVKKSKSSKEA